MGKSAPHATYETLGFVAPTDVKFDVSELDMFDLLVDHPDEVLTNSMLADVGGLVNKGQRENKVKRFVDKLRDSQFGGYIFEDTSQGQHRYLFMVEDDPERAQGLFQQAATAKTIKVAQKLKAAFAQELYPYLPPQHRNEEFGPQENWSDFAACASVGEGIRYPKFGGSTLPAKLVCSGCTVMDLCLESSLERADTRGMAGTEAIGVVGGLSRNERRTIRRMRAEERPATEVESVITEFRMNGFAEALRVYRSRGFEWPTE